MAQTRRSSSPQLRKKLPDGPDIFSYTGSTLDKTKQWDTPFGMAFTISELLRSLPLPGIKTEFYQTKSGPQAMTTFPSIPLPISDDKETRETVYKRTAEKVRILGSRGVPQNDLWTLLTNFDPWNRNVLRSLSGNVSAIRIGMDGEQKKLQQLTLLLSDPPSIYPLPQEELTRLREYASQLKQMTESVEQKVQEAKKHLAKAEKRYVSKKSSHLNKIKGSLFQLIRENTGWSRKHTAKEQHDLLAAWNADLAGKESTRRTASYRS